MGEHHDGETAIDVRAFVTSIAVEHGLSSREAQVLQLTVQGACRKEVAGALDCSTKTVETYWVRLLCKLHVSSMHMFLAWLLERAFAFAASMDIGTKSK